MADQPALATVGGRLDLRRWAPALLAGAVLAVAVHLWGLYRVTGPPSPPWFPSADKAQHLVGFGLPVALILLAAYAYRQRRGGRLTPGIIVGVSGVFAVHAVVSEVIQHVAYTTRSGDWRDAVADVVGIALAVFVVIRMVRP